MGFPTVTIRAFTGGAGCGKTHQLMQSLADHLDQTPLNDGQKVLALTFMHGSRQRLDDRLGQLRVLRGKTDCSTLDSFAGRLVQRWSSLAKTLGFADIRPDQYELMCDAAGALLQIEEVCGWVSATFPIVLVDEAQDMTANRLRIVKGLATKLELFIAADEFQCLNEKLRPNPAYAWLADVCSAKDLTEPRRTNIAELLSAAAAIRRGAAPQPRGAFMFTLTSNPPHAGAWLNGNLNWYGGGKSVAVITPSLGQFARATLEWAAAHKTKKGCGPYSIQWEESEAMAAASFIDNLPLAENNDVPYILAILTAAGDFRVTSEVTEWLATQRRAKAKVIFSKAEISQTIKQIFAYRRRVAKANRSGWLGMTVHGAKNREFDNVIVLWPAAIGGSDDQKRRLLYNAVTRAKQRCLVLIQSKQSLAKPPFV